MAALFATGLLLGALVARGTATAMWTDMGKGCCPQIESFTMASYQDVQLDDCKDKCVAQGEQCGFISFNLLNGDCTIFSPSLRCVGLSVATADCRGTESYRFGPDVPPSQPQVPTGSTDGAETGLITQCDCGGKTCSESVAECVSNLGVSTGSTEPGAPLADGKTLEGTCREAVETKCSCCKYCMEMELAPAEKIDARPGSVLRKVPSGVLAAATFGAVAAAALAALLAGRRAAARGSGAFRAVAAPESDAEAARRGDSLQALS